jgi:phenylacetate-coenzyme A ligase PaaK-like adenylate-forming protein
MTKIQFELEPRGVETLPLSELHQLEESRLEEWQVVETAAPSSPYQERWRRTDLQPSQVHTYADLRELPCTTPHDIVQAECGRFGDRLACSPGLKGELVVSTFSEALPLIRYRTGDLIRVVSTDPCSCGITHPRVAFRGRRQDTNIG